MIEEGYGGYICIGVFLVAIGSFLTSGTYEMGHTGWKLLNEIAFPVILLLGGLALTIYNFIKMLRK